MDTEKWEKSKWSKLPPTYVKGFQNAQSVQRTTYRKLGQTDIVVSKLSLGGAPFGDVYGKSEESEKIIVEALRNGVNYIDTAYWYGQGKSEKVLGKVLRRIPRKSYYIATKVGRYEQNYPKMFDFRAEKVLQSVDDSLARLGLCCVDIIQVHDLEFAFNDELILSETLPALEKVRNAGKCRYIGITGYQLCKLAEIIQKSSVHIDTVLTFCRGVLHDNSLSDYIPLFQSHGVGVINASPTSMGLLTPQGPPAWHFAPDPIKQVCDGAVKEAKANEVSISRLANHHTMNFPGSHTCLAGIHSMDVLKENLLTSWSDLSDKEKSVKETLMEKYFKSNAHWEGVQEELYMNGLKNA